MSYSVVVTSYNSPELLQRFLAQEAVKNAPEVIVVQMGKPADLIVPAAANMRFLFIPDPCSNAQGVNAGFHAAQANHVIYCNDDIVVNEPDTFDRLHAAYEAAGYAILSPKINVKDEYQIYPHTDYWEPPRNHEFYGRMFGCCMISKEAFYRIGEFDGQFFPAYYDDTDFWHRCELLGLKFAFHCLTQVMHVHGSTVRKPENEPKFHRFLERSRAYYTLKWGGGPGQEVFKAPFNLEAIA